MNTTVLRWSHRLAGVVAGMLAVWLGDKFGIQLTDEHVGMLQGGVTVFGLIVFQVAYFTTHRALKGRQDGPT